MLSPLPRRSGWAHCFAHSPQPYQPSPITLSGRPAHCPFRGLLGVHSRYGLHTRAVTVYRDTLSEGFSHFVTSMTAPVASGWSGCRAGLAPTGKRRLSTAHGLSGHARVMSTRPRQPEHQTRLPRSLVLPEVLEPIRCQRRVPYRRGDAAVAKVVLDGTGVVPVINLPARQPAPSLRRVQSRRVGPCQGRGRC